MRAIPGKPSRGRPLSGRTGNLRATSLTREALALSARILLAGLPHQSVRDWGRATFLRKSHRHNSRLPETGEWCG